MTLTQEQREQIRVCECEELHSLGYSFLCEDGQAISFEKENN